ncbi:predicted protein [Uncinocarpus reesii 1704]|uniref:Uncharacterized protein n=1 Tax=Uncinocarpus reesii (strain UAMH 1704) TaxID=336963 RepID=C4JKD4_UNCRE|nr:uncharacterized protein UREG_02091 [Uncinocarpus reesii 1704]EEP77242.1 predicted protein [Uncinocarpus reesii 1704]
MGFVSGDSPPDPALFPGRIGRWLEREDVIDQTTFPMIRFTYHPQGLKLFQIIETASKGSEGNMSRHSSSALLSRRLGCKPPSTFDKNDWRRCHCRAPKRRLLNGWTHYGACLFGDREREAQTALEEQDGGARPRGRATRALP